MTPELSILAITAASIGFFHTIMGPDHYLPFIMMARAGKWSLTKTTVVTLLCGLGHVASSVVLGLIGVALGIAVTELEAVEAFQGGLAAWVMITFGLVYFVWGLRKAIKNRRHEHWHFHVGGNGHNHKHVHIGDHSHVHQEKGTPNLTPWILFTVFVFGPCEPLIPILMYPAAKESLFGMMLVTCFFGGVTIITMLGVVLISSLGFNFIPFGRLERYTHALAGFTVCLCGATIQFLGL